MRAFLLCILTSLSAWASANTCTTLSEWQNKATGAFTLADINVHEGDLFVERRARYELNALLGRPVDSIAEALVDEKLQALKNAYYTRGYFQVALKACIELHDAKARELALRVDLDLGERAYIRKITFHGVEAIKERDLESVLLSKASSFVSHLLSSFEYGALQMDEDRARVINYYQSQGFLDARIQEVRIRASDDLRFIDLDIDIVEGAPYVLGRLEPEAWAEQISIKEGDRLDLPQLEKEVDHFLAPERDEGYAFAKAVPEMTLDNQRLSLRYHVEKGEQVVIRDVVVHGEELTKAHVIAREFKGMVGQFYNQSEIERMRQKLLALGVVSEAKITIEKSPIEGLYDLVVTVRDAFPLRFGLTPTYFAGEGLLFSAYVMHQNLLGQAIYGLASAQVSSIRQTFDLALYDPRVRDSDFSWLSELHHRQLNYLSFESKAIGGGMRSFWNSPNGHFAVGGGLQIDEVRATPQLAEALYAPYVTLPSAAMRNAVFVATSFQPLVPSFDRNRRLVFDARLTYVGAMTASDFDFFELSGGVKVGFSLSPFLVRGSLSVARLFANGNALLPITERYFLGGQRNLRGYGPISVGPFVTPPGSKESIQIGGVSKWVQTVEVEYPLLDLLQLRAYVFSDLGNSYAENQRFLLDGVAASVGVGLLATVWSFPLMCEVALPLVDMPGSLGFDFYAGLAPLSW